MRFKDLPFKDKIKHFVLAFVLSALIFWLVENQLITIIIVLGLSLLKELIDQIRGKNNFKESAADILVDVLGITFGILFTHYLLLTIES